jgi:hypothetical protein
LTGVEVILSNAFGGLNWRHAGRAPTARNTWLPPFDHRRRASVNPPWILPIIISSCAARRVSDQPLWIYENTGTEWRGGAANQWFPVIVTAWLLLQSACCLFLS